MKRQEDATSPGLITSLNTWECEDQSLKLRSTITRNLYSGSYVLRWAKGFRDVTASLW